VLAHAATFTTNKVAKWRIKNPCSIHTRLGVEPQACVMVGDMMIDDISGALALGMRAVWKRNETWIKPDHIIPTATITHLSELLLLLQQWQTHK
jgi:FMN phosphatase YigB (HAD superfamily)